VKAARRLLGPGVVVYGYARGRAKAQVTGGVLVALGLFFLAFTVALYAGVLLFPGLLLFLIVYGLLCPPRPMVVTDRGVALLAGSVVTDRPSKILARRPSSILAEATVVGNGSKVEMTIGSHVVRFKKTEFDRLTAAARMTPTAPSR